DPDQVLPQEFARRAHDERRLQLRERDQADGVMRAELRAIAGPPRVGVNLGAGEAKACERSDSGQRLGLLQEPGEALRHQLAFGRVAPSIEKRQKLRRAGDAVQVQQLAVLEAALLLREILRLR